MKGIEKIVFNELSSRRAVVLPSVGTLKVVRQKAVASGKKVVAPMNVVVFTTEELQGADSVVDMVRSLGVEKAKAEKAYKDWLNDAQEEGRIQINGVGYIKDGTFTPFHSLENNLNPVDMAQAPGGGDAGVPGRSSLCLTNILLGVIILLLLSLGLFYVCRSLRGGESTFGKDGHRREMRAVRTGSTGASERANAAQESLAPAERENPGAASAAASATGAVAGSASASGAKSGSHNASASAASSTSVNPAASASRGGVSPATSSARRFYVVAGTFNYMENADRMVEWYARKFPNVKAEKVPYRGGRTMVVIYSADNERDANRARDRFEIEHSNYQMWVYEAK